MLNVKDNVCARVCACMEESVMKYHFSGLISYEMCDVCASYACVRLCEWTDAHCPSFLLYARFDGDEKKKKEKLQNIMK